jgi:cobalamin biosynthesis protein CobC
MSAPARDHGGGLDAAIAVYGGARADWLDLSTGINPIPYPLPEFPRSDWQALPDSAAQARLIEAARRFWRVPEGASVLAAPGASALIARVPALLPPGRVSIATPTYNEHAAAFAAAGWQMDDGTADARVIVHPNNPDGRLWDGRDERPGERALLVIDESFCDVTPKASHIGKSATPGVIILKSFGKFWGLAGARLGFAIGPEDLIASLRDKLGPWPVAGPALRIGAMALEDTDWAEATRARLAKDAARLDGLATGAGWQLAGGTDLFRLYNVGDAMAAQESLARRHVLSRIFPYSDSWLRLGLPGDAKGWAQLENALRVLA